MAARVTIKKTGAAAVGKRQRQTFLRESVAKIGEADHRIRKPSKFTRGAKAKYGHVTRTRKYINRKLGKRSNGDTRAIGVALDFVWSGVSRSLLMASNKIKPTARNAEEASVDVIFNAPVFNFAKLDDGTSVRDDFLKSNPSEVNYFYKLGHDAYTRRIRRAGRSTTKTVG